MKTPFSTVSVVVPAYNAEKTIGPLLDSLMDLDYQECEVIVVNDGSTDLTRSIVEGYPVKLINQTNRGASAARDAGLRVAQGDVVAYVDSDVIVERDWLTRLVIPFEGPSVAATTGQTIFLRNSKCTSWVRSLDIERRNARRKEYTKLANGPNCAFRRDVLLEVGGFDPSWYHAEDTEVSYRIWQAGYRIQYVPEAIVRHVPEEDWRVFLRKRYRDARAFTRVLRRYPRSAAFEDDFVEIGMKIQPPLFLAMVILGASLTILAVTPFAVYGLFALLVMLLAGVLLNIEENVSVAIASQRPGFLLKSMALSVSRGFAWGLGLGVGAVRQVART